MSIKIKWCKLLGTYLRQDLLEHELVLVSTTKECATVEDRVTETKSKAAVRGFDFYLAISLTHIIMICDQELSEIELVATISATKERTSVEDRVMDTVSNAVVRRLIHPRDSCLLSDAHLNPGIV